ncbi:PKD domain containing protein [Psychromonas ingrahamii 37]|uniref:PKD domain containing protein n=1 Tax=Psychromonas ingrahamii (strain DSM 17664 / CCUG 51855 / 37) TaxID=357804 RepID=A1SRK0_PSYIN|nr:PKD domain-containing protein [Psychromonas ingrahamii]ABM02115.1 PKD domain containing protein [Psychromonas ingrahamii 37]
MRKGIQIQKFLSVLCFFFVALLSTHAQASSTISGTVYGGPAVLEGASVGLLDENQEAIESITADITDSQGLYHFPMLADGTYYLTVTPPQSSGFPSSSAEQIVIAGNDVQHNVVLLGSAVKLSGYLKDSQGRVIDNTQITLHGQESSDQIGNPVYTDSTGYYEFSVAPGEYKLKPYLSPYGWYESGFGSHFPDYPVPDSARIYYLPQHIIVSADTVQDAILPLVWLSGKTVDANGVAVPGVQLKISHYFSDYSTTPSTYYSLDNRGTNTNSNAISDENGDYQFAVFANQAMDIIVTPPVERADLAVTTIFDVDITNDTSMDLAMVPSVKLSGYLKDSQGRVIDNTQITLHGQESSDQIGNPVYTDSTGYYEFSVAPGEYKLRPYLSPYGWYESGFGSHFPDYPVPDSARIYYLPQHIIVSADTVQDAILPWVWLSGKTVDANGVAVPGVQLKISHYFSDYSTTPSTYYSLDNRGTNTNSNAISDENGDYQFAVFANQAMDIIVTPPVERADLAVTTIFDVDITNDTSMDLAMVPSVKLSGYLKDSQGRVIDNTQITLHGQESSDQIGNPVYTDSTGYYEFSVAPGEYKLRPYLSPYGWYESGFGSHFPDYPVPDSARIYYLPQHIIVSADTVQDAILPLVWLSGKTVDANGVAVPGVQLKISHYFSDYSTTPSTYYSLDNRGTNTNSNAISDENGDYQFAIFAHQAIDIAINPPEGSGFAITPISGITLTGDTSMTIVLDFVDTEAPLILNGPMIRDVTSSSAVIEWTTDEPTNSVVSIGGQTINDTDFVTYHVVPLSGLSSNTPYTVTVKSTDAQGNGPATGSSSFTRLAQLDTQAPVIISGPLVEQLTHNSAVVKFETDEVANGVVRLYQSDVLVRELSSAAGTMHEVKINSLSANTQYSVRVEATDALGNGPTVSLQVELVTLSAPDLTAPVILSGPLLIDVTSHEATVLWTTDEPAISGVSYNDNTVYDVLSDEALVTEHRMRLTGLKSGVEYFITVSSEDANGNGPTLAGPVSVTTLLTDDINAPILLGAPLLHEINQNHIGLFVHTDESAVVEVLYGTDQSNLNLTAGRAAPGTKTKVNLQHLEAATRYYFQLRLTDEVGNTVLLPEIHSVITANNQKNRTLSFAIPPTVDYTSKSIMVVNWRTHQQTEGTLRCVDDSGNTYSVSSRVMDNDNGSRNKGLRHQASLTGMTAGEYYSCSVVAYTAKDGAIEMAVEQQQLTASTQNISMVSSGTVSMANSIDNSAPMFLIEPTASYLNNNLAIIGWETDELANASILYWAQNNDQRYSSGRTDHLASQQIVLSGLSSATHYEYQVTSTDLAGNQLVSAVKTLTTNSSADNNNPSFTEVPQSSDIQLTSLKLTFLSDELATAQIRYGLAADRFDNQAASELFTTNHAVVLTGLEQGSRYYVEIVINDPAGNSSVTETLQVTTTGVPSVDETDTDNDGVLDVNDAFAGNAAASTDTDSDGQPDNFNENCTETCVANSGLELDLDDDNDGYSDVDELANETDSLSAESLPSDNDGDFVSDLTDTDDDNDGVLDVNDAFAGNAAASIDTDSDGQPDSFNENCAETCVAESGLVLDVDDDNDGALDTEDAFPLDAAESVDTDGDLIGNNTDTDDDGDLIEDTSDTCPLNSGLSSVNDSTGDIQFFQYCLSNDAVPQIHFELELSDSFSSSQSFKLLYWLKDNEQHWITLTRDSTTGIFIANIELNQYTASGLYNVRAINLIDNQGNEVNLNENQLNLLGFTTSVSFDNPIADTIKPSPKILTSSGWLINEEGQPQVNFSLVVEDNLSGVQERIVLELNSPTGVSLQEYGTKVDVDTYHFDFALNKYANSGEYTINTIRLYDNAGNSNNSQSWILENTEAYALTNPNSDSTLSSLSYINIDVKFDELSDRPILMANGLVTDDVSGVQSVYLRLTRPNNGNLDKWQELEVDTNKLNLTFSSEIALPQIYENGEYKIDFVRLIDFAENENYLYKENIEQVNQNSVTSINLYYPDDDTSNSYDIDGSTGDDFVFGANRSDDYLVGLSGNDYIFAGNGDDHVVAGEGNDLVIGGSGQGNDNYEGDAGVDTLKYTSAELPIIVDFISGTASGVDIDNDIFSGFEKIIAGQNNDVIITDANPNIVYGYDGDDIIVTSEGADELTGGNGKDEFIFNDLSKTRLSSFTTIVDYQVEDTLVINGYTSMSTLAWSNNLNDSIIAIPNESQLYFTTDGNDGYLITVLDINAKENSSVLKLSGVNDLNNLSVVNKSSKDNDGDGSYNYFDTDDDNDGIEDTLDAFINNVTASIDTDLDGQPDSFHSNCDETCVAESGLTLDLDDDNDGYSDVDELANDTNRLSAESLPSDNDGDFVSDLTDTDDDNDGVLDVNDAFTGNAAASIDTDSDGQPDNFNENCTETCVANSDLVLDVDDDNDGVLDVVDNYPVDNSESIDTDGDLIGNNADTDDDADGIIDLNDNEPLNAAVGDEELPTFPTLDDVTVEATGANTVIKLAVPDVTDNNLNSAIVSSDYTDALSLGDHEITWTATDFAGNKSTAIQLVHIVDTTAPSFGEMQIQTIDARGLRTNIANDITILAHDLVDGDIEAKVNGDGLYSSGVHIVAVSAQDASGNKKETEVEIHINPQAELSKNRKVEPGATIDIPVHLTGNAANYPVTINYEVTGVNLVVETAQITINEGVNGLLQVTIPSDAVNGEIVKISLKSAANAILGDVFTMVLAVDVKNYSPRLHISIEQNDKPISIVDTQGGRVTITAVIDDMNILDTHDLTWNTGDDWLVDLNADAMVTTFELAPERLAADTYSLSVKVKENNTTELYEITIDVDLVVNTALDALSAEFDNDNDGISDFDEGYADSDQDGISDYLDTDDNPSHLPIGEGMAPMQTINGLSLSLGDVVSSSRGANAQTASVDINDIAVNGGYKGSAVDNYVDSQFTRLSNITNFNLSGLSNVGDIVPVVIPLAEGRYIPEAAIYRKYNAVKGWFDFIVDDDNALLSAFKDSDGNCPAPLSSEYEKGLIAGDNCIQLLIKDGSNNDADGLVNGVIKDPGVLAIKIVNQAPVININTRMEVNEESDTSIDASGTTDAENDTLTYQWSQVDGTLVTLTGEYSAILSFTTPSVSSDELLTFELEVNDGQSSTTENIEVLVTQVNQIPSVTIGSHDASFNEGTSLTLSSQGLDADDNSLSYLWEQISGPSITISDATLANVTFTTPQVSNDQTIELKVTVSDGIEAVSTITSIEVKNVVATTAAKESSSGAGAGAGGGSMGWWFILLGFAALGKRSFKQAA